jgi:hypothetical protein
VIVGAHCSPLRHGVTLQSIQIKNVTGNYVKIAPTELETAPCAGIFKNAMGASNRVGKGLSYWPARLHRLAESITWNSFRGSLKVHKIEIFLSSILKFVLLLY